MSWHFNLKWPVRACVHCTHVLCGFILWCCAQAVLACLCVSVLSAPCGHACSSFGYSACGSFWGCSWVSPARDGLAGWCCCCCCCCCWAYVRSSCTQQPGALYYKVHAAVHPYTRREHDIEQEGLMAPYTALLRGDWAGAWVVYASRLGGWQPLVSVRVNSNTVRKHEHISSAAVLVTSELLEEVKCSHFVFSCMFTVYSRVRVDTARVAPSLTRAVLTRCQNISSILYGVAVYTRPSRLQTQFRSVLDRCDSTTP